DRSHPQGQASMLNLRSRSAAWCAPLLWFALQAPAALACSTDGECGSGNWCDTLSGPGVCEPQVPNGQPVPGGTCNLTNGARACASGVCDANDNLCGYGTGDGPCSGSNNSTVCRSGLCATSKPNSRRCVQCLGGS